MDAQNELDFRLARSQFLYEQADRKTHARARALIWAKRTDAAGRVAIGLLVVSLAIASVVFFPQILSVLVLLFVLNPVLPILLFLGLFVMIKVIAS